MWHSHLPMVILHLNQANKARVYLLRSLSRKLSMPFEKLRESTPTSTRPLGNRWCFLTRKGLFFFGHIGYDEKKKHSIINLDDFRQTNPMIEQVTGESPTKIYAKCLVASAQLTTTLWCDWTDAGKINALLYLNQKSNEEICVSCVCFLPKTRLYFKNKGAHIVVNCIQMWCFLSFRQMFFKNCNYFGFVVSNCNPFIERHKFAQRRFS